MIQGVAAALLRCFQGRAIDPVDVQIPISLHVEKGGASSLGFDDVTLFRAAADVAAGQSQLHCPVDEEPRRLDLLGQDHALLFLG